MMMAVVLISSRLNTADKGRNLSIDVNDSIGLVFR